MRALLRPHRPRPGGTRRRSLRAGLGREMGGGDRLRGGLHCRAVPALARRAAERRCGPVGGARASVLALLDVARRIPGRGLDGAREHRPRGRVSGQCLSRADRRAARSGSHRPRRPARPALRAQPGTLRGLRPAAWTAGRDSVAGAVPRAPRSRRPHRADQGHGTFSGGPVGEGPGGERDDRGPHAQRPVAHLRSGQRAGLAVAGARAPPGAGPPGLRCGRPAARQRRVAGDPGSDAAAGIGERRPEGKRGASLARLGTRRAWALLRRHRLGGRR